MQIINLATHAVCPELLDREKVVLDLGAHVGEFATEIIRRFNCKVYAIEASPSVCAGIPEGPLLRKFNVGICATSGPVSLNLCSNPEATSLKRLAGWAYRETITIPGTGLEEFVRTHSVSRIDLLKVDIEGAEIEVLQSCSDAFLQSIEQITVEFHEWAGVSSRAEVKSIMRRLRVIGFFSFKLVRGNFSNVLFVNRRQMSRFEYVSTFLGIWVPRIIRYVRHRALRISRLDLSRP